MRVRLIARLRTRVGQIFFFGWIALAFMILLNIFVGILMESYAAAKVTPPAPHPHALRLPQHTRHSLSCVAPVLVCRPVLSRLSYASLSITHTRHSDASAAACLRAFPLS